MRILFAVAAVVLIAVSVSAISAVMLSPVIVPSSASDEKVVHVDTASMEPEIKDGATLYYKTVPYDQIAVNDIVLFQDDACGPQMIVGRVTNITVSGLIVKGDANPGSYNELFNVDITASNLVGKVTRISNP